MRAPSFVSSPRNYVMRPLDNQARVVKDGHGHGFHVFPVIEKGESDSEQAPGKGPTGC